MSGKTIIIDSSVWIASLNKDDFFHFDAIKVLGHYMSRRYLIQIPLIVLVEVLTVMARNGFPKSFANKFVKTLESEKNYQIITMEADETLGISLKYYGRFNLKSLDNYILLYQAFYQADEFLSFDIRLRQAYNHLKSILANEKNI